MPYAYGEGDQIKHAMLELAELENWFVATTVQEKT